MLYVITALHYTDHIDLLSNNMVVSSPAGPRRKRVRYRGGAHWLTKSIYCPCCGIPKL